MQPQFTAGAWRAFQLASTVARAREATEVDTLHLLWGLVLDESRAAARLAALGFAIAELRQLDPHPGNVTPTLDAEPLQGNDDVERVVMKARQIANSAGDVEIGTEHLLGALSEVASRVQPWLVDLQIAPPDDEPVIPTEPLETELRLVTPMRTETDHTDTFRILDAAANRAREGLRVVEDYVRFALDDAHLMQRLKSWRHDLAGLLGRLSPQLMLASRDTRADVGTIIHTPHELARSSLVDVAVAAFKRTQEAARTLEECTKVLSQDLSQEIGAKRYELYSLEKSVFLTLTACERLLGRNLYLLLTESLCPRGSGPVVRAALQAGVGIVQIREKSMTDRQLLAHARRVREWTQETGALLVINDRPDIAVLANADGVHLGQDDLTVHAARRIVGPSRLVGVSTHDIDQARQAVLDGADYLGVGPTFQSTTKSFTEFAGLEYVKQVAQEIRLPFYCIGGITPENIREVTAAGGRRVAVSSAICGAANVADATQAFQVALAGG